jgi:steroid delta-isomerase-like uncharacterized protein
MQPACSCSTCKIRRKRMLHLQTCPLQRPALVRRMRRRDILMKHVKRTGPSFPAELAADYLAAWNRRDAAAVSALFARDGVYIDSFLDRELSGAAITRHVHRILAAIPDIVFEVIGEVLCGETTIASRWILRGTSAGKLATLGPAGAAIELRGADFLRLREGAIASVQIYYDTDFAPATATTRNAGHVSHYSQPGKYGKSGLSESEARHLRDHLLAVMAEERPFLDPDLTLAGLADHLGVSTNHLSQVINSQCQQSFWEFLNHHRVEEAKRRLREAGPRDVLQVAMDAGFRSKSSFYTAFKRHTRMTPREYLDAQR